MLIAEIWALFYLIFPLLLHRQAKTSAHILHRQRISAECSWHEMGFYHPPGPSIPALEGENKINRICMSYSVPAGLLLACNYIIRHMERKFNGINWIVGRHILVGSFFASLYILLLIQYTLPGMLISLFRLPLHIIFTYTRPPIPNGRYAVKPKYLHGVNKNVLGCFPFLRLTF